ncbi:molybdenum cofactor synthesis 2 [Suillus discolor]|uniref:Molybdenum cofactor synthesis 2 n=1 Tax=Suillus discolor TaxID=1912936 RepID=A0A9P7K172_9AGAM|nr:molybdenum cofactor synthesis 2 [Suillus discolor]KAG2120830.1 molybdenum cofactor synthesis 2 [Suillus discolor]
MTTSYPSTSVEAREEVGRSVCVLTYKSLEIDEIIKSVSDDGAGATALFIGTTRNSYQGKVVTRLEYQAYSKLAIKTMTDIIRTAHQSATRSTHYSTPAAVPCIISCAVHHRLGTVPVGEPSIVIAVSSPHRKEAFVACEQILEEVKQRVQIWKREYYEGEKEDEAEWKANSS